MYCEECGAELELIRSQVQFDGPKFDKDTGLPLKRRVIHSGFYRCPHYEGDSIGVWGNGHSFRVVCHEDT